MKHEKYNLTSMQFTVEIAKLAKIWRRAKTKYFPNSYSIAPHITFDGKLSFC